MGSRRGVCTYCGKLRRITRDHVPPKALFKPPRPELVTVPACSLCHKATSTDDEYFRAMVALRHDADGADAVAARESFFRSLDRPEQAGFRRSFVKSLTQVPHVSPAGLHLGRRAGYNVDLGRMGRVMSRVVRGLYRHELALRLPTDASVTTWSEDGLRDLDLESMTVVAALVGPLGGLSDRLIGDGTTFRYRYLEAGDMKYASAWLLTVYGNARFLAVTLPRGAREKRGR